MNLRKGVYFQYRSPRASDASAGDWSATLKELKGWELVRSRKYALLELEGVYANMVCPSEVYATTRDVFGAGKN